MKTTRSLIWLLALTLLAFLLFALSTPTSRAADPVIVRVMVGGATSGTCGGTWETACGLQYALTSTAALPGTELWVAAGTYTPTAGTDRTISFQLRDNIALYGGFAGGETLRNQRNITSNVTILSGDLEGNDNILSEYPDPTRSDNSYHVVSGSGVASTAMLDGFTVIGGNANGGSDYDHGGGMYNDGGSPTLTDVTFSLNFSSSYGGGGIYNHSSSPTLERVIFVSNQGFMGGGMYNDSASNPTLTNVTFYGNSAPNNGGGGMYNAASSPVLTSVAFSGNSALDGGGMFNSNGSNPTLADVTFSTNSAVGTDGAGGGMFNDSSSPTLTNVTFSSNTAAHYGGGMSNKNSSSPVLINVTFTGNWAWVGAGMHTYLSNSTLNNVAFISNTATGAYGGMASGGGSATLTNVTFSGNSAPYGGGMGNETKSMMLTNVTFSGNTATYTGGGMENYEGSATLTNVTFSGNSAGQDGGGIQDWMSSNPTIHNAIFWGNTAPSGSQIGNDDTSTASVSYSVVQGGCPAGSTCTHFLTADPRLGTLGNYGGSTQTIRLLAGSSAIDAGNNAICPPTDQRGKPRVGVCDSGAFEFQSLSLAKTGGDQQSTRVNTPFANSLQVTLTDMDNDLLLPGILVTFTAPSSGASAAWSGSPVVTTTTNASGVATVAPPTANGTAGSYVVTATTAGTNPPATFSLTNLLRDSFLPLLRR